MNIYKISQTENKNYDTYDSAIVTAENAEQARHVFPGTEYDRPDMCWVPADYVKVEFIGTGSHVPGLVLCASFNAG